MATAKAAIAPVTGHPSAFPVSTPLPQLPKGKEVVYVSCTAPFCVELNHYIASAAAEMGLNLKNVPAGGSSQQLVQAWNAAVQLKPAAVIGAPVAPELIQTQLKQLHQLHIPVVSLSWSNATKYGATVALNTNQSFAHLARLQADWIIAHMGFKANAVFYYTPELAFARAMVPAFEGQMHQLCPTCTVRAVAVPLATLGTTSSQLIVSDLQSHPDTNVAAADDGDPYDGLPSALRTAGRKITLVSANGTPITWGYVKDGEVATDLAGDTENAGYQTINAAAWAIHGGKIPADIAGFTPVQFLTPSDITPTVLKDGWTAYPNNAARWAKLWGVKP